ncbi:endonuclease domain-containing protein [Devosia sp.]|jgi:very-short-patch-repair endonuclease|uniref:endonuclease domain-containing protein n=1 Tax=Devosia sp. TaxID=1871048 RepID=UPI0037C0F59A
MAIDRARTLRKTMPPAEAKMWNGLRSLRPLGHHFRRQVPVGPYYADFVCHAARLIVEVDGDTHFSESAHRYDATRDDVIRAEGYRILRVTNHEVMRNIDGVLQAILTELARPVPPATPTLSPSPQGGGRRRSRAIIELGQRQLSDLPPPVSQLPPKEVGS